MKSSPTRSVVCGIVAAMVGLLLLPVCSPRKMTAQWQAVVVPTDAVFGGIWFTDSLNGWVTGGGWAVDGGIVGRTRDGGRTWRFQSAAFRGWQRIGSGPRSIS